MTFKRLLLGRSGEDEAVRSLKKNGYRIVERNYRCRYGEIDIVALDGKVIVFVEVKTRTGHGFGAPGEAVDLRKQLHIARAAQHYIAEKGVEGREARFDVVGIVGSDGRRRVELIKDAFTADVLAID